MSYLSEVLADAPVHYWRMADPGGGLAHDIGSSPHALHGLGTAISQPLGYSGPNNDGGSMDLCLDGVYANTGNPITIQVDHFTIELLYWNWQHINALGLLLQIQSSNQIALYRDGTNWHFLYNGASVVSATGYTEQRWHHLAATYDGASMRLYVDSVSAGPTSAGVQGNISNIMELGANNALSANWGNGFFSEVAIYHSALSGSRIGSHFASVDSLTQVPINTGASGTPGPSVGSSADIAAIRSAVEATYANAP